MFFYIIYNQRGKYKIQSKLENNYYNTLKLLIFLMSENIRYQN